MKNCTIWIAFAVASFNAMVHAGEVDLAKTSCWAREKDAMTSNVREDGRVEIVHCGKADWNIGSPEIIPVNPGEAFWLRATSRILPSGVAPGAYGVSAIVWDKDGAVIDWNYGVRKVRAGETVEAKFMVPENAAKMQPRVVGHGETSLVLTGFAVEALGNLLPAGKVADASIRTEQLEVTVCGEDASVAVKDLRTGRLWKSGKRNDLVVTGMEKTERTIRVDFIERFSLCRRQAFLSPLPEVPEVLVTVVGDGEMRAALEYPNTFETKSGDRLIVPMNEGISYPADDPDGIPSRLVSYSGHGICMSFFGVQDDQSPRQDGYMAILETADDAAVVFGALRKGSTISPGVSWEPQKGAFGYPRRVRLVFFEEGGYVAMAKRYRAWAKAQGKLKTFTEKAKERPLVERLLGAPNIWCTHTKNTAAFARKLKEAGMDRFLWSAGGSAKAVEELSKMDGVLVSTYDIYRDIYHPEQLKKLGWTSGKNSEAWPEGVAWNSADSNDWRKAWGVQAKDGSWTYCACMCDAVSGQYCRERVLKALQTHPYNTRFIDVTTASGWDICYNPAHPMTRTDSKKWRMDLLRLLGEDFGLVVGSETGHDAAVPYCDYFEGMLSLGNYRVPDAGRRMSEVWTNVPPRVAKFQVGAAYRLPLWELVYHDCVCAHWYWGDYNNKLPSLWDKRDLFNLLYGTMEMYFFREDQWDELGERFLQSYRLTSPVARKTGKSEMLYHKILSSDRMLQRTAFADGTIVTVNFGEKPLPLPEGGMLEGMGYLIEDGAGRVASRHGR